jgi:methanogenic corrinoid protein MtbC1
VGPTTHGICVECAPKAIDFEDPDFFTHAEQLSEIQRQLFKAGQSKDLGAAEHVIDQAAKANIRSVDILFGIMAPMLYQIGEDWKKGVISVAQEHRYTSFCEKVFDSISFKSRESRAANVNGPRQPEVLLMNAPGNNHTMAIRFLALWMADKGTRTRVLDVSVEGRHLISLIKDARPRALLISMALAEQSESVRGIVSCMAEVPLRIRPRVVVGGYAVKSGLISPIPRAELVADISSLSLVD